MEPITTDGGLQVTGEEQPTGEHAVVAPLEQLFTGLRVGLPSLELRCSSCGTQLGEGDQVSVYAYRRWRRHAGISPAVGAQTAHPTISQRRRSVRRKSVSGRD